MQVTETQSEGLKREFKVLIAAKDIDEKMEGRLKELGGQVKVPGFRPGKVPLPLLKKRFGASVMGEVLERAVNDSSSQAISERGLRPAMQPKIEITAFDDGKDLEYTMAIELLPEIEPMDFSTLELERLEIEVPDEEVQKLLERLAGSQKQTRPLEKPRKAIKGDVLVIDFRGTVDGEEFPGMSGEDHHLELGANQFIEGFEDQLIGVDAGESCDVNVTFPEAYANEKLAGRDAVFSVTVKQILKGVPVTIDDEMAVSFGEENLESLKAKAREQVLMEYSGAARAKLKRQVLDCLAEAHEFPVPEGMADLEFETIWKQIEQDREAGRLDSEDAERSKEDLEADYRQIAERRVRLGLLISEVGRINQIEVTQDEVNKALMQEVQRYAGQEREVFEYYQRTPEALANLRAPVFEEKVIDFIVNLAKVTKRAVSPEQLREEMARDAEREIVEKKPAKKSAKGAKSAKAGKAGKADKPAKEKKPAAKKSAAKPKSKS
jgi:trigger factor